MLRIVLNDLEFQNPPEGLKSLEEQIEALKPDCNYIDRKEVTLDDRVDEALHIETATTVPGMVKETYQYVSLIELLTFIMSNDEVKDSILSKRRSEDALSSFIDGEYYKQHEFFKGFVHAFRIQLYCDHLEVVGRLGFETGVHKLGVF